jgi:ATP-dependent helicase/DNAse subunit B
MTAAVHVVCGPAGSGKTERFLENYRSLMRSAIGTAVWIGPNRRAIDALRPRLLTGLGSCLGLNLFTFQDFAEEIIRTNDGAARPLANVQRRLLAGDVVARLHARGKLSHFQAVIDSRGFGEGVLALLAELKRNGVAPEELLPLVDQESGGGRISPRARQCALLYEEYQQELIRHHLFDLEGRFWHARDLLKAGRRRPFQAVRAVFLDGFSALTRVQHDIGAALAGWVEEIWISLPNEPADDRAKMFSRPRSTLDRLREIGAQIEFVGAPVSVRAVPLGLTHLERQLFRPLRAVVQAADADGIRLLEAPGMLGETRMVARSSKTLLLSGVPADDILVTMRDVVPYADLVREVFDEYGIPVDLEGAEPLHHNRAVSMLLRTLRLPEDDWPFPGVTALLRSSYLRPNWPETQQFPDIAQHAEALLRLIGEPRGRSAFLAAADRWADNPPPMLEDEQAEESRRRRTQELAQKCRPFLRRFFGAWDRLPARETLANHVSAVRDFAEDLGLASTVRDDARDASALARLWEELDRWVRLEAELHGGRRTYEAAQFHRMLYSLAWEAGLARSPRGPGRVRVLSAPLVRALPVPYLFIMGLGERSFPRLAAPEPFFEEPERQRFKAAGLDFLSSGDLLPDEMLLFYQVVTRARRQLVLSYPAVDDKGQSLLPSSFLNAVLDCFGKDAIPVERKRMLIEGYDREAPLCPAEHRVRLAANGGVRGQGSERRGQGSGARGQGPGTGLGISTESEESSSLTPDHSLLTPCLSSVLRAAARVAHARFEDREFGPYDGLLQHPEIVTRLHEIVGPQRVFSPTALENYIACPFRFFLGHILRLEPLEEPRDEIEGTQRGQAFHRALSRLHEQLRERGIHEPIKAVEDDLEQRLAEAVNEYADRSSPASEVLWNIEGQRLRRLAARYPPHWSRFIGPWNRLGVIPRPRLFEVSFGMPPQKQGDVRDPLLISVDGIEVRMRGRIDRVDVAELEGGLGFWVIDYKTGRSQNYTARDLQSFERLQLTLYALAVERVLFAGQNARPLGMAYWLVADKGPKRALPPKSSTAWLQDAEGWPKIRDDLEWWVASLADQIRHGVFPLKPRSETCTETCQFSQVCRISQSRGLPKNWDLPLPVDL